MRVAHQSIGITDRSSVGEARRAAISAAAGLSFSEDQRSNIGIVATEAANNILLHAQTGEFLVCPFRDSASAWIDLFALDTGPGIHDVGRAMEDGFSTTGTAGHGLGAIKRLSDASSILSVPEKGTVYWSRFLRDQPGFASQAGIVSLPLRGESVAGDSFLVLEQENQPLYVVVDGLGHGGGAAEAAIEAIKTVRQHAGQPLVELMTRAHEALKKTRGAAMSIALVDWKRRSLTYAGIGNVSATLVGTSISRNLVSQNGTLGAIMPRVIHESTYSLEGISSLVMFSDGLASKTSPTSYPGFSTRHPALLAGLLYRDFSRKRDDATVLVAPMDGMR